MWNGNEFFKTCKLIKTNFARTVFLICAINYENIEDWSFLYTQSPHRWCYGKCARLECGKIVGSSPDWVKPDYKIGICCFSAMHVSSRRKIKDWLAQNRDNVSKWGDMSIHGLLFQWASTINIQLSVLV